MARPVVGLIQEMRRDGVPEEMQDGFWMGLQAAVRHPAWAAAMLADYQRVEGSELMVALTARECDAVVARHPVSPADGGK